MIKAIHRRVAVDLKAVGRFSPDIRFFLVASALSSVAMGMFSVVFNLYVLSLGIGAATLGTIVGTTPLAEVFAAIPAAFIAERIGYRKSMLFIYAATGLTQLARAAAAGPSIMMVAGLRYWLWCQR